MPHISASAVSAFALYHSGASPILSSHFSPPSAFVPRDNESWSALSSPTPLVARNMLSLRSGGQYGLNMVAGGEGAAAAAVGVVLKNFSGDAVSYFAGVRTPASLIAGSSLGALFSLKGLLKDIETKPRMEQLVIRIYHVMVLLSFFLSLSTIVVATAAIVTVLHGLDNNVMAETAYLLLRRELDFEFISCRWAYLMSLLTFLVGVTGRVLLEFNLLTEKRQSLALGVVFGMTTLVSHLFAYINSTLYCWDNFLEMTVHLIKLMIMRMFNEQRPLQLLALASACLGTFFGIKGLFYDTRKREKKTESS